MARTKQSARKNKNRNQRQSAQTFADDDDDSNYLMVGGVRINVSAGGQVSSMARGGRQNNNQRQRRSPPSPPPPVVIDSDIDSEDIEIDSDDMLDFLQNVGAARDSDSEENSDEEAHVRPASATRHYELLRQFCGVEIGDEGAPEDVIGRFYDEESESEESSEEDEDFDSESSSSSFSSDGEEEEEIAEGLGAGVLTAEQLEELHPVMRYPVAVRPAPPPISGEKQLGGTAGGGKKRGHRPGVKGAKGGKLAPGEKAKLRRERIEAKRAQRAVGRGFDLASINKELENFVKSGHDMHAFALMTKHECRQVQRLARLYGCKAGAQGSGKKRAVIISITERTALPQGATLLEVGKLLAAHTAEELGTSGMPGAWQGPGAPKGRWTDLRSESKKAKKKNKRRNKSNFGRFAFGSGDEEEDYGHAARRKLTRPVAFVSKGLIYPEDDAVEVYRAEGVANMGVEMVVEGAVEEESEEEYEFDRAGLGAATHASVQMLTVFEDKRGGDETVLEMGDAHVPSSSKKGAATVQQSLRGAEAAEGITNSGRLLGLGMALGIGAEVFGAPLEEEESADLSPLQPKLSKSAQRKLARRRSSGGGGSTSGRDRYEEEQEEQHRRVANVSGDFADFEQNGTGIGSKLLAKWGFAGVGSGLGKQGTGIKEPLQVKMRPKKLGLGADR